MWYIEAVETSWHASSKSKHPLDKAPVVGGSYRAEVAIDQVSAGDAVNMLYLPPLVYLNGFETEDDVAGLRIVSGRILDVADHCQKGSFSVLMLADVTVQAEEVAGLDTFAVQSIRAEDTDVMWDGFLSDATFKNVLIIGDMIVLRWAHDSHVGEELLLEKNGHHYNVLYRHGWQTGAYKKICGGRVRAPSSLGQKLDHRLSEMRGARHWYGRALSE